MCEQLQRAVLPIVETLEGRVLLSASAQGTTLTVDGNTSAPNKICVSYVRKTHSVRVVENRARQDFPIAGLTGLQITGGSSRDVIAVAAGVSLPTTINGMGGNDQITGNSENDTIITGQGNSIIHPGLGINSIDLTLGSNRVYLTRKAADTIIATKQDKVIGATSSTQIVAPSAPAGAPASPPIPPAPPLPPAPVGPPELIPGTGFTGPTPQPAAIGTGFGSDATSIARWDVVPYQTFAGTFNVGVVAFHATGIDHISFSVNGGAWANVSQMTLNPQTNVVEYTAELKASDFAADGQVEVRAIAYPKVGVPRVLDSLFLNANPNGSLGTAQVWVSPTGNDQSGDGSQANPYATLVGASINAPAGATVYLQPGSYTIDERNVGFRDGRGQWLNYEPAPGVASSGVTILVSATVSMRADSIAFHNVSMDMSAGNPLENSAQNGPGSIWLDNVNVFGSLATGGTALSLFESPTFAGNLYVTGCSVHDLSNTPFTNTNLIRNTQIKDCFGHGVNDPYLMINSTIDNIVARPNNPDDHVDGIFWYNPGVDENSIVYGVTLTNINGLCLMSDQPPIDIAVINVSATAAAAAAGGQSQFGKGEYTLTDKHIVIDNLYLPNQSLVMVDTPNNTWSDSIIENCVLFSLFPQPNPVVNCTLVDGTPIPNQS